MYMHTRHMSKMFQRGYEPLRVGKQNHYIPIQSSLCRCFKRVAMHRVKVHRSEKSNKHAQWTLGKSLYPLERLER